MATQCLIQTKSDVFYAWAESAPARHKATELERLKFREGGVDVTAEVCSDGRVKFARSVGMHTDRAFRVWRKPGGTFKSGYPVITQRSGRRLLHSGTKQKWHLYCKVFHKSGTSDLPQYNCAAYEGCSTAAKRGQEESCAALERRVARIWEKMAPEEGPNVYCLVVGYDTDDDAVTLHRSNGAVFSTVDFLEKNWGRIPSSNKKRKMLFRSALSEFDPQMPEKIFLTLMRFLVANAQRVIDVRKSGRPLQELEHTEDMMIDGTADLVPEDQKHRIFESNDASEDLDEDFETGLNVTADSRCAGRIAGKILMQTVVPFDFDHRNKLASALDWADAEDRADRLVERRIKVVRRVVEKNAQVAQLVIDEAYEVGAGVMDRDTRQYYDLPELTLKYMRLLQEVREELLRKN